MRNSIAVNHLLTASDIQTLKREALMFNQLGVTNLNNVLSTVRLMNGENPSVLSEYEWLCDQGILIETKPRDECGISTEEYLNLDELAMHHALKLKDVIEKHKLQKFAALMKEKDKKAILRKVKTFSKKELGKFIRLVESLEFQSNVATANNYLLRGVCIQLREIDGLDAYPMLIGTIPDTTKSSVGKTDVIQIVINALPIPNELTSWQDILEFRNDTESYGRFLALRNWMSDISRQNLTLSEVEEKLEYLLYQYQKHLELHKIKTRKGTLEAIVISSAEFLEDLANKKFSKLAKGLFAAKQRQIELLEGELNTPGKEVAYIVKAQEEFDR